MLSRLSTFLIVTRFVSWSTSTLKCSFLVFDPLSLFFAVGGLAVVLGVDVGCSISLCLWCGCSTLISLLSVYTFCFPYGIYFLYNHTDVGWDVVNSNFFYCSHHVSWIPNCLGSSFDCVLFLFPYQFFWLPLMVFLGQRTLYCLYYFITTGNFQEWCNIQILHWKSSSLTNSEWKIYPMYCNQSKLANSRESSSLTKIEWKIYPIYWNQSKLANFRAFLESWNPGFQDPEVITYFKKCKKLIQICYVG